jgi:hypothetical protein
MSQEGNMQTWQVFEVRNENRLRIGQGAKAVLSKWINTFYLSKYHYEETSVSPPTRNGLLGFTE